MFSPADAGNAVATQADIAKWDLAGTKWLGGTLKGITSKIGYLKRLGVTTLWISPVLRQRKDVDDYHGYGIQNFLEVDPHFGTDQDFKDLVAAAHNAGLYAILDVVLNHSADVFQYNTVDPAGNFYTPPWTGATYPVLGWRDPTGAATLPFPIPSIWLTWAARCGPKSSSLRTPSPARGTLCTGMTGMRRQSKATSQV